MGPRQCYLTILQQELAVLPPALVNDILCDFDRHFDDALAAGRSEREAARRLGDPIWLAHELCATALV